MNIAFLSVFQPYGGSISLGNTANPASYYSTVAAIRDASPSVLITRNWMPYVAFSLGSVSKLLGTISSDSYIKNTILNKFVKKKIINYMLIIMMLL